MLTSKWRKYATIAFPHLVARTKAASLKENVIRTYPGQARPEDESDCLPVRSYNELIRVVGYIKYEHPELELFMRGTIKFHPSCTPSISRSYSKAADRTRLKYWKADLSKGVLFDCIQEPVAKHLSRTANFFRQRPPLAREAIAQHYGGMSRFLDITTSLQTALTFSFYDAWQNGSAAAFIHVYLLPRPTGAISRFPDLDCAIIDLRSLLPSYALRPHIQEAYSLALLDDVASRPGRRYKKPHPLTHLRYLTIRLPVHAWKRAVDKSGLPPCPCRALSLVYPGPADPDSFNGDRVAEMLRTSLSGSHERQLRHVTVPTPSSRGRPDSCKGDAGTGKKKRCGG